MNGPSFEALSYGDDPLPGSKQRAYFIQPLLLKLQPL